MKTDAQHWDEVNKKIYTGSEPISEYAQEKEANFPRNSIVLDMGGGTGSDALYFLQKGHAVIILDISEYALEKAKQKAVSANLIAKLVLKQTDYGLEPLPVKDSSIDIVYSRMSIHYFESEHTINLLKEINRVLKLGGTAYLALSSPENKDEMEHMKNTCTEFEENVFICGGQLKSRYTVDQLKDMLTKAGITSFTISPRLEKIVDSVDNTTSVKHLNEIVFSKNIA